MSGGQSGAQRPPHLVAERVTALDDDDLQALCEATDAAILDGGGFGWITSPGRRTLEQYFHGILLVPERALFVGRLDGVIVGATQLLRPPRNNEAQAMSATLMPTPAATDVMASLRWCQASVFTAELSKTLPSSETNRNKPSFTTTTTTRTMRVNGLGDRCGSMISPNAVSVIHSAAPNNIAATMAEAIGSALPWP